MPALWCFRYVKAVGFLDIAIALCESPRKRAECEKARESYVQRGKQVRMLLVNPPAGRMTVHRAASLLEINPTSPEASDARVFLLAEVHCPQTPHKFTRHRHHTRTHMHTTTTIIPKH